MAAVLVKSLKILVFLTALLTRTKTDDQNYTECLMSSFLTSQACATTAALSPETTAEVTQDPSTLTPDPSNSTWLPFTTTTDDLTTYPSNPTTATAGICLTCGACATNCTECFGPGPEDCTSCRSGWNFQFSGEKDVCKPCSKACYARCGSANNSAAVCDCMRTRSECERCHSEGPRVKYGSCKEESEDDDSFKPLIIIIGAAVGALVILVVVIAVACLVRKKRRINRHLTEFRRNRNRNEPGPQHSQFDGLRDEQAFVNKLAVEEKQDGIYNNVDKDGNVIMTNMPKDHREEHGGARGGMEAIPGRMAPPPPAPTTTAASDYGGIYENTPILTCQPATPAEPIKPIAAAVVEDCGGHYGNMDEPKGVTRGVARDLRMPTLPSKLATPKRATPSAAPAASPSPSYQAQDNRAFQGDEDDHHPVGVFGRGESLDMPQRAPPSPPVARSLPQRLTPALPPPSPSPSPPPTSQRVASLPAAASKTDSSLGEARRNWAPMKLPSIPQGQPAAATAVVPPPVSAKPLPSVPSKSKPPLSFKVSLPKLRKSPPPTAKRKVVRQIDANEHIHDDVQFRQSPPVPSKPVTAADDNDHGGMYEVSIPDPSSQNPEPDFGINYEVMTVSGQTPAAHHHHQGIDDGAPGALYAEAGSDDEGNDDAASAGSDCGQVYEPVEVPSPVRDRGGAEQDFGGCYEPVEVPSPVRDRGGGAEEDFGGCYEPVELLSKSAAEMDISRRAPLPLPGGQSRAQPRLMPSQPRRPKPLPIVPTPPQQAKTRKKEEEEEDFGMDYTNVQSPSFSGVTAHVDPIRGPGAARLPPPLPKKVLAAAAPSVGGGESVYDEALSADAQKKNLERFQKEANDTIYQNDLVPAVNRYRNVPNKPQTPAKLQGYIKIQRS